MLPLPATAPQIGWNTSARLPRDHYVRLDANDYSVHPAAIGRLVEVRADLDHVTATCGGKNVAQHERCRAAHQTLTDPAHQQAARNFRRQRLAPVPAVMTEVEQRRLTDYDHMFGLAGEQANEEAAI